MDTSSLDKNPKIILASGSASRKQQLVDLGFNFSVQVSGVDEDFYKTSSSLSKSEGELVHFADINRQIAQAKVEKVAQSQPLNTLILGGDQMAVCEGQIFNKAFTEQKAIKSLMALQGKKHILFTALFMQYKNKTFSYVEHNKMTMRHLTKQQVMSYVKVAQPLECAGCYALERHGLALFKKIETKDQSAIIGFPLITLINQIIKWGIPVPCLTAVSL